jgi:hypothetical protein
VIGFIETYLLLGLTLLGAYRSTPGGRTRGLLATALLFAVGWAITLILFIMPSDGIGSNGSVWKTFTVYLVAFVAIYLFLGWIAMLAAGVQHEARAAGRTGFLVGAALGALLMTVAVMSLQEPGIGPDPLVTADGARLALLRFGAWTERWTGSDPYWLYATAAIGVPWVMGFHAAARRIRRGDLSAAG